MQLPNTHTLLLLHVHTQYITKYTATIIQTIKLKTRLTQFVDVLFL